MAFKVGNIGSVKLKTLLHFSRFRIHGRPDINIDNITGITHADYFTQITGYIAR